MNSKNSCLQQVCKSWNRVLIIIQTHPLIFQYWSLLISFDQFCQKWVKMITFWTQNGHFDPFLTLFWPLFGPPFWRYCTESSRSRVQFSRSWSGSGSKMVQKWVKIRDRVIFDPLKMNAPKIHDFGERLFWGGPKITFFSLFFDLFFDKTSLPIVQNGPKRGPRNTSKIGCDFFGFGPVWDRFGKKVHKRYIWFERRSKKGSKKWVQKWAIFWKKGQKRPFFGPFFSLFEPHFPQKGSKSDIFWKGPKKSDFFVFFCEF